VVGGGERWKRLIALWLTFSYLNSLWQIPLVAGIAWHRMPDWQRSAAHRKPWGGGRWSRRFLLPTASVCREHNCVPAPNASYCALPPDKALATRTRPHSHATPTARVRFHGPWPTPPPSALRCSGVCALVCSGLARLAWAWRIRCASASPRSRGRNAPSKTFWTRCLKALGLSDVENALSRDVSKHCRGRSLVSGHRFCPILLSESSTGCADHGHRTRDGEPSPATISP